MRYVVNYRIKDKLERCVVWDARKPLAVGYPAAYVIDLEDGQLALHALRGQKVPSLIQPMKAEVNFADLNIKFKRIESLPKVDPALVATAKVPNIAWLDDRNLDHDYKNFRKLSKRTFISGTLALFAIWATPIVQSWLGGNGQTESPMIAITIKPKGGAAPGEKVAPPPPASYARAINRGQSIERAQNQAKAAATPEAQTAKMKSTFASLFKSGFGISNPAARKPASAGGAAPGAQLAAVSGSEAFEGGREGGVAGGKAGGVLGGVGLAVGVTGGGGEGGYGGTVKGVGVGGQGDGFLSLNMKDAVIDEGLTKDEVGKVIHSKISEIRYCYESSMVYKPDIEGKLVVDFTIAGNGGVKVSSVKESSVQDSRLDDCILRRLAKWQFPKPKSGVDVAVTYPFIFKKLRR